MMANTIVPAIIKDAVEEINNEMEKMDFSSQPAKQRAIKKLICETNDEQVDEASFKKLCKKYQVGTVKLEQRFNCPCEGVHRYPGTKVELIDTTGEKAITLHSRCAMFVKEEVEKIE
ncbi:MAG: hypothetical protein P1U85_21170 [Verrucomicrobiales bacterium]|nr:hypothetical protein [Verrucomicrobiales bacterium]